MDQTCTLEGFLTRVQQRDPHQTEFAQAVREVMTTLWPFLEENPRYRQLALLERLVEPERVIQFRVVWVDDRNQVQVNRAWRVQFNSAIGPYKGGMRFHPSVNLSILKFLGFEQTFKNALTTLPMGGGKGGSDFDPKGKSDGEVMRFCQALMTELYRHLGPDTDVPAGDIGVGGREVGFMAGMMRKLSNNSACVFTGKGLSFGGSLIRPEATGYGLIYFTEAMLKRHGLGFEGARVAVSGSGNVAQYAIEKAMELGARVVTASDSNGTVVDEAGFTKEKLARLIDIKERAHGRVADYAREFGLTYLEGQQPWSVPVDIALPCATQNELDVDAARQLIANGVKAVAEGANMPTTIAATDLFPGSWRAVCPGQSGQRRRRGDFRSGDGAERRAHGLESGKSGCPSASHHAGYPPRLRAVRRRSEADQLRARREYRRFRESRGCHAGPGRDLTSPDSIPAAARRDASHDVIVITTFPRC